MYRTVMYRTVQFDDTVANEKIRMNRVVRRNLRVRSTDVVRLVCSYDNV